MAPRNLSLASNPSVGKSEQTSGQPVPVLAESPKKVHDPVTVPNECDTPPFSQGPVASNSSLAGGHNELDILRQEHLTSSRLLQCSVGIIERADRELEKLKERSDLDLERLKAEVASLRAALDAKTAECLVQRAYFMGSRSWRYTQALRRLKTFLENRK